MADLLKVDDWHEHDGFVNDGTQTSWDNIFSLLASDADTVRLSRGDWEVRFAVFPTTYDFYFRIYVPADYDNDYPERRGEFDVTSSPEMAAELAQAATSASGIPTFTEEAKVYFDSHYGG